MRVRKRVEHLLVHLGGQPPSGWLPKGAAVPLPTPRVLVDFCIQILEEAPDGYILEWRGEPPDYDNDTWHASLEDAMQDAEEKFGIARGEWLEVDEPLA